MDSFQTTHWTKVLLAADPSSIESQRALEDLCQAYWMPLYSFARSRTGDADRAKDLTQTFFALLLEKDFLRTVDPSKGRFRGFLLTAMKRLMANEWNRELALKRGGGRSILQLDFDIAERRFAPSSSHALTAEQIYLRDWARTLLDQVLDTLRCEFERAGNADQFAELKSFISVGENSPEVSEVAERLGISAGAARVAVHRLRRRFRQTLRSEVSRTVDSDDQVEDEIRSLFNAFS